jgi:hypothetical protein
VIVKQPPMSGTDDPKGQAPARRPLKARILPKANASETGETWSDRQIAEALGTSTDSIAPTRQQLVGGSLDAALTRRYSPNSARNASSTAPPKPS